MKALIINWIAPGDRLADLLDAIDKQLHPFRLDHALAGDRPGEVAEYAFGLQDACHIFWNAETAAVLKSFQKPEKSPWNSFLKASRYLCQFAGNQLAAPPQRPP